MNVSPPPECPPLPPDVPFTRFIALPPRWRWEAVRRHPFYVWGWARARRHRRAGSAGALLANAEGPTDREELADFYANIGVAKVGVTGVPADPSAGFGDLPEHFFPPQAGTAVYQPPIRGLLAHLLLHLPDGELATVALLCKIAVDAGGEGGPGRGAALDALAKVSGSALDRPIDGPFFHVDPFDRKQTVSAEVERARAVYRDSSPGLAEAVRPKRSAEDKLAEQFRAWDLREGWSDGGYEVTGAVGNKAAAVTIGDTSDSTVSDDYKTAFQYIFGTRYTPADRLVLHCETVAYLLPAGRRAEYRDRSGVRTDVVARRSERHGGAGRRDAKQVPDSQLSSSGGGTTLLETGAAAAGTAEVAVEESERREKVAGLVATGQGDAEIARLLSALVESEVPVSLVELVRAELDGG